MSESQKQFDPLQPPVVSPQPPPHTPFDPSLQKTLLKIYRIAAIIFVSLFFLGAAIVGLAYWRASVLRQQAWAEMQEDEKAQREAAIQWQKEEKERQKEREEESRKRQEAYRIAQAEREAAAEKYRAERAKRDAQKALEEERRKKER